MLSRPHSTDWAAQYLGIPFVERGDGHTGADCWSLYARIMREQLGRELPDYSGVPAGAELEVIRTMKRAVSSAYWQEIKPGDEQPFDCVLMRGQVRTDGRMISRPIHVGCVVEPGTLIHTEIGTGVSIGDYRRHPKLRCRVEGFYRMAG